jgi:hypothetical protein
MTRLAIIATIETPRAPQSKFFRVTALGRAPQFSRIQECGFLPKATTIRVKLIYFGAC